MEVSLLSLNSAASLLSSELSTPSPHLTLPLTFPTLSPPSLSPPSDPSLAFLLVHFSPAWGASCLCVFYPKPGSLSMPIKCLSFLFGVGDGIVCFCLFVLVWGFLASCGSSWARDSAHATAVIQAAAVTMLGPQPFVPQENSMPSFLLCWP